MMQNLEENQGFNDYVDLKTWNPQNVKSWDEIFNKRNKQNTIN